MDVEKAVQDISSKYQCDPKDPMFAVLEKVDAIRSDIARPLDGSTDVGLRKLNEALTRLEVGLADARELSGNIGQNILAHAQLRLRDRITFALLGGLFPTLLIIGMASWYFTSSSDSKLRRQGVGIYVQEEKDLTRIELSGDVLKAGQTDKKVVINFKKRGV